MKKILILLLFPIYAFGQHLSGTDIRLSNGSAATAGTTNGTIYFDTGTGTFMFRQGNAWVPFGAAAFQSLTDGPGSFSGKSLNYNRVNVGETALEYRTPSQVLSDIGGQSALSGTGYSKFSGSSVSYNSTIPNADLTNSAITIAGNSISLGGSIAQDNITGLSSTGLIKRTGANTLAVAASGIDYQTAITFGTGVQTALGVNIGSAGAPVLFNGAGGTPASINLSGGTGLPPTTGINGWPSNASGVLTNDGGGSLSWVSIPSNPMTTVGDLIQGGTSGAPARLADVATGNVLLSGGAGASVLWGKVDVTSMITGITALANGGTNASLTASNGGIVYSTSSAQAILAGTATANKILLSGATAAPTWSTSTIPTSAGATANKVLLSDGTNYVLSTPTFPNASATSGKTIRSDGTNWIASTATLSDAPSTSGKILKSDGTNWITSTETYAVPSTSGNLLTSDGTNWTSTASTFWNLGGTSILSSPITIIGTTTNTIKFQFSSIAQTFNDGVGLYLKNTSSASNGSAQYSPLLTLEGQAWSTTSGASMITKWGIHDLPVDGAAAPVHYLAFKTSINGSTPTDAFRFGGTGAFYQIGTNGDLYSWTPTSSGTLTLTGTVVFGVFDRTGMAGFGNFGGNALANLNKGVLIQNTTSTMTSGVGIFTVTPGTVTASVISSGTPYGISIGGNWNMASGTASWSGIDINTTISTSSTYAGIFRGGIRYHPSENSLTGITHYFITDESTTSLNGWGVSLPTAKMHIIAGSTTIAPLQINSSGAGLTGLLTTALKGAFEFTDYGLWFSPAGSTRHKVLHGLTGASAPSTTALTAFINYYGTGGTVALSTPTTWITITGDDGVSYKIPAY